MPRRRAPVAVSVAVSLAALSLAGCAGGDESTSTRCGAACERDETCNLGGVSPFCDSDCPADAATLLPEFRDVYLDCHADLPCDVDEQDCEVEASRLVDRRPVNDFFLMMCQTKHTECDEGFESDFCFQSHYYLEDRVNVASACLTMTCDTVSSCLRRELPFAPFDD